MRFMNKNMEHPKEKLENRFKYDICEREKLWEYTEKSTMHPKLADGVHKAFQFYYDLRKEPKCRGLSDGIDSGQKF